ncbi:MAG: NUDIX domain-containing protein [Bacteroidetes bacterium]|nr:NUDIX domain-containing protein [Bacteroidota bacterium]
MRLPDNFLQLKGVILKAFLEDRMICLVDHPVEIPKVQGNCFEFQSAEQLRIAFEEFENDKMPKNLYIWENPDLRMIHPANNSSDAPSIDQHSELLPAFLSLFKIIEAAGGVVKNERGEWLFIFRRGKWDLPKGKISARKNPGKVIESQREAAIREVKEETGLRNVMITKELPCTYHIYYQKEKRILKPVFWFEMFAKHDQELVPEYKEDILMVKWISVYDIQEILQNTFASIREILSGYGFTINQ